MSYLSDELLSELTKNITNYYLKEKNRLPNSKEFNSDMSIACSEILFRGYTTIPKEKVNEKITKKDLFSERKTK